MKTPVTTDQAKIRVLRAFRWAMRDETKRWDIFRAITRRYQNQILDEFIRALK